MCELKVKHEEKKQEHNIMKVDVLQIAQIMWSHHKTTPKSEANRKHKSCACYRKRVYHKEVS